MPTFRVNNSVDPQQISGAFDGIAKAFAPPSAAEVYAGAKAQQTRQQIQNTADLYAYATDPNFRQDVYSRRLAAAGIQNESASMEAVDRNNRQSGLNNAADNARAVQQTGMQQRGETERTLLAPVGESQTRFIPPSIATAYGLPAQQVGAVKANEGQTVALPGGGTVEGRARPVSSDEAQSADYQRLPEMVRQAIVRSKAGVQAVQGDNGPVFVMPGDALGRTPAPAATAPSNVGRLQAERAALPAGDPRVAEYDAAIAAEGRGATADGYRSASDTALAKRHADLVKAGDSATGMIGNLDALEPLLEGVPTGALAERRVQVAKYAAAAGFTDLADGLTNGKLDQAQAANAIVQRMAPLLRVPGSGAQSDRELQNFLDSVASLRNTPGGNRIIIGTMRAAAERQQQAADIARQAQAGTLDKFEAERQIAALPSPFARQVPTQGAGATPGAPAGGDAGAPAGRATGGGGVTAAHIAALRANPDRAADFDAKFGAGLAATILGGR